MFNQLLEFRNQKLLVQALTNKIHEIEYFQKTGKPYCYGNNEEFSIGGQQLIEFYFYDYMLLQGFPNQQSQFKKPSDIIQLRQRLINDKYLSEIAILLNLQNLINVGNQKSLRNNPKVQNFKLFTLYYQIVQNQSQEPITMISKMILRF